ncbi:MAG: Cna B-type domain-containing protein [Lachnospiraceae bacterium]
MKKQMKISQLLFGISLFVLLFFQRTALAASGSVLTLEYNCSGAKFQIYRVGDAKGNLSDKFSEYPVSLDCSGNAEWLALANTLSGYVSRDKVTPDAETETDTDYEAVFEGLKSGWYLITGTSASVEEKIQKPVPFILWLDRDVSLTSQIKWEEIDNPKDNTWSCTVKKVWNDSGNNRPESVAVQLLKDGNVYETVILSSANDWSHTWDKLSQSGEWNITEKQVPAYYTVSVTREGDIFTVTNSRRGGSGDPGDSGGNGGGGGVSGSHSSIVTGGSAVIPEEQVPMESAPAEEYLPEAKLPQTGQLWWPVPILAAGGTLFLLAGIVSKVRRRQDNED